MYMYIVINLFFNYIILIRIEGQFTRRKWEELFVGDFVRLSCDEVIPADLLILESSDPNNSCYIQTSNLDGETTLKQRQVPEDILESREPHVIYAVIHVHVHVSHMYL